MRALLTHPLHRLTGAVLLVALSSVPIIAGLPRAIGFVSDYGSVLDRSGRERLSVLIEEVRTRTGLDVFILATWENPLSSVVALADGLLSAWDLERRGPTVLAVFLRDAGTWRHAVVANRALGVLGLPERLSSDIRDLVEHDRIEEAMVRLVENLLEDARPASAEAGSVLEPRRGRGWTIPVVLAVAALLILLIRRRLCPRCGRLLHVAVSRQAVTTDRVYFCRSCGFRRAPRRSRR